MELGFDGRKTREELEYDEEKWVYDSSVDHRGRPPLRASTGVWKASLFIIAIEFSERLCYFGLATNLILYLNKVLHQELKTAAKSVNYWQGVTTMMPLIGGFIADAYLGRFSTVMVSSMIYLLGLSLLTMSQFIPSLKPCHTDTCKNSLKLHEVVFFISMYLISVGTGGHKPSLESFGADQFDDDHVEERKKKMSYFNWWSIGLCCGLLLGVTVIVYVQDFVSWGVADIVLTSAMAISLVIFFLGRPFYRYRSPEGSPLTPMLQVLVAAVAKRRLLLPSNPEELYEVSKTHKTNKRLLCYTRKLRLLDKAAIIEPIDSKESPNTWRLATVTQVEEVKLVLATIPIWITSLPFGICVAQTSTFFIKQGSIMDRRIGAGGFEIPSASIFSLSAVGMVFSICFYDKILVPFLRRSTRDERGISILKRIGIGMVFSIVAMVVAALVERKRLMVAAVEGTSTVSMSVFWLAPQYMILGLGDGFALVGLQEYFYDQVPDGMRSLGIALYLSVIGFSNFLSSLLITLVDQLSGHRGRRSWFAEDLNNSRLDCFYWVLSVINGVNLFAYIYVASRYSYKSVQRRVVIRDDGTDLETISSGHEDVIV